MAENGTHKKNLRPDQFRAVAVLVATGDTSLAANAGGVSMRTLRRWLSTAEFMEELARAETDCIRSASRRLAGLVEKALSELETVLDDQGATHNPRIRAASVILDTTLRWRERLDLEERLSKLEKTIGVDR